ncbi:T9SS type A sorting domain-containing protein [Psychroflexus sp. ALD_RP9]|uniref:T9SS type A sorting domain-containing protein n=1 Tax=Psychroflexus sp. ALD_RP9 TaxID=2777186 RepID=UPI001A8C2885|nr:T9SS type A sorting domain-containing protein [Psychroflexus sp. ALD_RP9]QSS96259.1 T9SS type A sorting domain-containing protein [Psychroflexus sp. ALD_RP9]
MKSKLLFSVFIALFFNHSIQSQTWAPLGSPQFSNDPSFVETEVSPINGNLYVAYVDASDQNHLKVMQYDGNNWVAVGSTVSTSGNVSFPDINFNLFTNEPWVAYREDISGTGQLMVKRFDGTNWIEEGNNIGYNGNEPTERIQIHFENFGNGEAYVAAIYEGSSSNSVAIVTNKTGSWTTEHVAATSNVIPYGLDYDSWDRIFYARTSSSTSIAYIDQPNGSWANTYSSFPSMANNFAKGFGATSNGVNTNFKLITFQDLNIQGPNNLLVAKFTNSYNQFPLPEQAGEPIMFETLQLERQPNSLTDYVSFVKANGEVIVVKNDESLSSPTNPFGGVSTIYSGTLNIGANETVADLTVSNTGEVFMTYKDGNSLTTREYLPNFQLTRIYVDANATGANDGSSWADAFTDLQTGINAAGNTIEKTVWVAQGTYNPGSNRNDSFEIDFNLVGDDIKLYGGFDGSETNLTDRDWRNNPTILTGDVNGNDDANLTYTNTTRAENNYNVVRVLGSDNVTIDGFTLTGGHANNVSGSPSQNRGGAIFKDGVALNFTLENCIITNNVSNREGNVNLQTFNGQTSTIKVQNNIFRYNLSRYASGLEVLGLQQSNVVANIYGNLFYENKAEDIGSGASLSGSSMAIFSNSSTITANLINNTFVNNYDTGTIDSSIDKGTVILRRFGVSGQPTPSLDANVHNNVFFNNYITNGNVLNTNDIGLMNQTSNLINNLDFSHNLTANESSLAARATNLTTSNNLDVNPSFANEQAEDFSLASNSAAIDAGDNSVVPTELTEDLGGNNRIENTTVDIGAYEFSGSVADVTAPTVITQDITVLLDANGNATITPSEIDNGSTDDVTAQNDLVLSLDISNFDCDDLGVDPIVTLTVEDEAGNSATATAIVTVLDLIAPTVVGQDITVAIDEFGVATVDPNEIDTGSTDNCGINLIDTYDNIFDCSQLGVNQATLLVNDFSNNVNALTVNVTVVDNDGPTVETQDITVQLDANGQATITAADIDNGTTDNCTVSNLSLDVTSFDCSNLGANTVTLSAEDASSNVNQATATVTIVDQLAPTLTTQDITIDLAGNNSISISPSDVLDQVSDNCTTSANVNLSLDQDTFTSAGVYTVNLTAEDAQGNSVVVTAEVTVDNTLSINEQVAENVVKLYPNPATSILKIESNMIIETVEIYDQLGRLVLISNSTTLNIQQLQSGLYFVKIKSAKNQIVKRLIKPE